MPADRWIALNAAATPHQLWLVENGRITGRDNCAPEGLATAVAAMGDLPVRATGLFIAPRQVPCPAAPGGLIDHDYQDLTLRALPALSQASPAHHGWGAEAAIAGFVGLNPKFDGVLCLPGAATVWAHISAQEIVSFQAFLTPQLAGGLTPPTPSTDMDQAISDGMSRPERLAERLASARATGMPEIITWGALIGAELAATRAYWLGQRVAVVGNGALANLYAAAIGAQGLPPIVADGEAMMIKGLAG
ncbi:2-dehydro-3-deoxygalactonokinase [Actibacterium sp. XHP0104]|uniref:2-dehydro-3-deoxygalactonokinase n=1 Tax=Actibacterium sp. XHP0104 TaxID=2984335 RepID=UPI0021E6ECFF|nr:2-dehydro-3-deoxygalactonokinase [Actibacterium sp. XHP0104]MCV2882784.1 2-dehydro-3-deoxygalactonokinase [Actibacterium sp. XHP0104]